MSQIVGEKVSLKKFFSDDYFFRVPGYQRPYSWKQEHCEQLFDDIFESNRENEYFLGTVILQEVESVGTGKLYDIIDGQQRITTLQILLACLRDIVEEVKYKNSAQKKIYQEYNPADGVPEQVVLQVREKNFFKDYIQVENGTSKINQADIKNDTQRKISDAIKVFHKKISSLDQQEIQSLIEHLNQRCVLIYVSTKNFDDAFRLFTIINDRGLQLRRIDILKANNLEPTVIRDEIERDRCADIWENIERELGSDDFEKLISFIRSIEIKEKAKDDILKEYNKLIFEKNRILKGKNFIDYVKTYKDIYEDLILDRDIFDEDDEFKPNSTPYKNLISNMVNFLPSNDWIPPILYFYKKYQKQKLLKFSLKLEDKFVADWISGVTTTKRIVNMNAVLKVIEQSSKPEDVIDSEALKYDKAQFEDDLNKDIYKSDYIKYLLLKLEYLESEHSCARQYGSLSVEHILPQKPKPGSRWMELFDDNSLLCWTNKIANLILLSKRKNSSASNLDFCDKKEKYFKGKVSDTPGSQRILQYEEWTPHILEERQREIISKLLKGYST